ncbi:MAG: sigma-54 dependent transcriptional regulator [Pseudomonadota bacterium]
MINQVREDILIVDDEADIRSLICGVLDDEGFETRSAADGMQALAEVRKRLPALLILDVWLGESKLNGLQVLERIHADHPNVPVLMISGHGTVQMAVGAVRAGAYDFICKPFELDELLISVERALSAARLARENQEFRFYNQYGGAALLGDSAIMQRLRRRCEEAAKSDSYMLLCGAAGTGKEAIARTIHERSHRANRPFTVINARHLDSDSFARRLFGSEALNGVIEAGQLEQAHGGSVLIVDADHLATDTRIMLARLLYERAFVRVSGSVSIEVNVRIMASISCSNESVLAEDPSGLFHRLAAIRLDIPSLDCHLDDIGALVDFYLEHFAALFGAPVTMNEEGRALLRAASWPANLRGLRNLLERAVIAADKVIDADLLEALLRSDQVGGGDVLQLDPRFLTLDLRLARELFEKSYLTAQMQRYAGTISRVADAIGMARPALHRKLKQLGLTD